MNNNPKNIQSVTLSRDNIDGLFESGHLSSYNFSGYLSRYTHVRKESKYHIRVGGRTTDSERGGGENKKKGLPSSL